MEVSSELLKQKQGLITQMRQDRSHWWPHWRDLADFIIPRRYRWLESPAEASRNVTRNPNILDGTATNAARVLAAGMMNGITSPGRPWLRLRIPGMKFQIGSEEQTWLDEVQRGIMLVMSESNFYNALAVMYLDLGVFGTAAMLIYEDSDSVIRCYNPSLGEYYLAQDYRLQINTFAREFSYKVHQVVARFGEENCSDQVKAAYRAGGARRMEDVKITHLVEPNPGDVKVKKPFVEYYWETTSIQNKMLSMKGFNDFPGICPRWELSGNDAYGSSPGMDALGDIIQLQHETKRKGQALDKMVDPPIVADIQLKHKPSALLPGGRTYVAGVNNIGIKPVYTVQPQIQELMMDIRDVQGRIRETFHNDLFQMISQLDTVRSATEIDARREEKLVRLGAVLERFENEALDPAIRRIFGIMERAGLLPAIPPALSGVNIEIQYVSLLSTAQNALAAAPTERFLGMVGQVAAIRPEVINIPNWEELFRNYASDIGVRSKDINPLERIAELNKQGEELAASRETAAQGEVLVNSAKQLSDVDVGGGSNLIQKMLGG